MVTILGRIPVAVGALALILLFSLGTGVSAQPRNPDNSVNPTADSVKEDQLLREFRRIQGRGTLPDVKSETIEQPVGREWRQFHEVWLRWIGAIAILGVTAAILIFYLFRGMVRIEAGRSGRVIVRFNAFERFVHWVTATCFVILAISGLNITFGKELLLPLMSPGAFSTWSQTLKYLHNYLSFPFTIGVVAILLMWFAGNIPNRTDVEWLKEGGGLVGSKHPPAYRFNTGQKAVYWSVVLIGGASAVTGYFLMFPFYGTGVSGMQLAQIIHGIAALGFIAIILGHIYIGTIGMQGAFEGMGEGTVDVNWARQHHSLWLQEEMARTGPNESQPQPRGRPEATPAE